MRTCRKNSAYVMKSNNEAEEGRCMKEPWEIILHFLYSDKRISMDASSCEGRYAEVEAGVYIAGICMSTK